MQNLLGQFRERIKIGFFQSSLSRDKGLVNLCVRKIFDSRAFSLVELAIVLVIIGLITGSILKGQELIESAKLRALIKQVEDTRIAVAAFGERYGALPGDFNLAKEQIDGKLKNGDNDQKISGNGMDINSEAGAFWQHLRAAGLLPSISADEGSIDFSRGLPSTKLGGGITISYGEFETHFHWFVIGGKKDGRGDGPLLTPAQAMYIDQRLDDGNGKSGTVRSKGDRCLKDDGTYNLEIKEPVCTVYIML